MDTWGSVGDNAQISEGYTFTKKSGKSKGTKLKCKNRRKQKDQRCNAIIPKGNDTKVGIEL